MANGTFDLRSANSGSSPHASVTSLRWPDPPGVSDTVESELGWMLWPWAAVPGASIDLLRVACAAYLADALTPRGSAFTRDIELTVAVTSPDRWTTELINDVCDLLYWLTGDQWKIAVIADDSGSVTVELAEEPDLSPVSLLSGGLDSFLGAVHLLRGHQTVQFIGHKDSANVVRGAQDVVQHWLARAYVPTPSYARVAFKQAGSKRERSARSRSLLFASLGVATATMRGSTTLYIPENGYTSLNVPLHPNRSGALSTRSTHPRTLERIAGILSDLGINIAVTNPFAAMTKGEVMASVASQGPPDGWLEVSWKTISCGKLDGGRLSGGNPNYNCGLCVPCMVRRGTYIAAGQPDNTRYLVDEMTGSERDVLIARRQGDLDAITYATGEPVDDATIDAQTWPEDYDLDAATNLVQRGLDELAAVPHP